MAPPVAGYTSWYDASISASITSSSGKVSQWNDQTTSFNLTQGTGANQPQTGLDTQNGLNGIRFTTANSTWLASSQNPGAATQTLFAVVKINTLSVTAAFTGGDADSNLEWRLEASNVQGLVAENVAALGTSTTALTAAACRVATYNTSGGAFGFYLNGVADGTGSNAAALVAGNQQVGRQYLGEYFDGVIYELIRYDSILSAANILTTDGYLYYKWFYIPPPRPQLNVYRM